MTIKLRDRHEELPEEADFRPLGRYVLFAALVLVAAGGSAQLLSSGSEPSASQVMASGKPKPVGAPRRAVAREVGAAGERAAVRRVDVDPMPVASIEPRAAEVRPVPVRGGFGAMQRAPEGQYQGFRVTAGR